MSSAKRLLLLGGVGLALLGMTYGLWYAVFAEHQALDGMGGSLAAAFSAAAARNPATTARSLENYRQAKYDYDRQVDVHGHWIGLAMLLIVLAIGFDRVTLTEKQKLLLAWAMLLGSGLFPLGVLLQTAGHGAAPRALAAIGAVLVIAALAFTTFGIVRRPAAR